VKTATAGLADASASARSSGRLPLALGGRRVDQSSTSPSSVAGSPTSHLGEVEHLAGVLVAARVVLEQVADGADAERLGEPAASLGRPRAARDRSSRSQLGRLTRRRSRTARAARRRRPPRPRRRRPHAGRATAAAGAPRGVDVGAEQQGDQLASATTSASQTARERLERGRRAAATTSPSTTRAAGPAGPARRGVGVADRRPPPRRRGPRRRRPAGRRPPRSAGASGRGRQRGQHRRRRGRRVDTSTAGRPRRRRREAACRGGRDPLRWPGQHHDPLGTATRTTASSRSATEGSAPAAPSTTTAPSERGQRDRPRRPPRPRGTATTVGRPVGGATVRARRGSAIWSPKWVTSISEGDRARAPPRSRADVVGVDVDVEQPAGGDHHDRVAELLERVRRRRGRVVRVEQVLDLEGVLSEPWQVAGGVGGHGGVEGDRGVLAGEVAVHGGEQHLEAPGAGVDDPGVAQHVELLPGRARRRCRSPRRPPRRSRRGRRRRRRPRRRRRRRRSRSGSCPRPARRRPRRRARGRGRARGVQARVDLAVADDLDDGADDLAEDHPGVAAGPADAPRMTARASSSGRPRACARRVAQRVEPGRTVRVMFVPVSPSGTGKTLRSSIASRRASGPRGRARAARAARARPAAPAVPPRPPSSVRGAAPGPAGLVRAAPPRGGPRTGPSVARPPAGVASRQAAGSLPCDRRWPTVPRPVAAPHSSPPADPRVRSRARSHAPGPSRKAPHGVHLRALRQEALVRQAGQPLAPPLLARWRPEHPAGQGLRRRRTVKLDVCTSCLKAGKVTGRRSRPDRPPDHPRTSPRSGSPGRRLARCA
jgi:hypothetical protein